MSSSSTTIARGRDRDCRPRQGAGRFGAMRVTWRVSMTSGLGKAMTRSGSGLLRVICVMRSGGGVGRLREAMRRVGVGE